ncbi:hypothetical protein AAHV23_00895 [Klebsiella pneumoniae]|nr:hypothetical protein [Klebsiella pneumoniae]
MDPAPYQARVDRLQATW